MKKRFFIHILSALLCLGSAVPAQAQIVKNAMRATKRLVSPDSKWTRYAARHLTNSANIKERAKADSCRTPVTSRLSTSIKRRQASTLYDIRTTVNKNGKNPPVPNKQKRKEE